MKKSDKTKDKGKKVVEATFSKEAKELKTEKLKAEELYEGIVHIPFGLSGVNYKNGQKFVTKNKSTFEYFKRKFLIK